MLSRYGVSRPANQVWLVVLQQCLIMTVRVGDLSWIVNSIVRRKCAEAELGVLSNELAATRQTLQRVREERDEARTHLEALHTRFAQNMGDQAQESLRGLTTHLRAEREDERRRLAHEVHDDLGQFLVALKMELKLLQRTSPSEAASWQARLDTLQALLDTAIHMVRRITAELRPMILDNFGLLPALDWQCQDFQQRTGIRCQFHAMVSEVPLEPERATEVFRMYQEFLHNVEQHARASRVEVSVSIMEDDLWLQVQDNGQGIEAAKVFDLRSLGLLGLREQAALLGGEVSIRGVPGQGTTIRLRIPLRRSGVEAGGKPES